MFLIVFGVFAFIVVSICLYYVVKSISSTKCDNADKYIELLKFQDTTVDTEKISNNSVKVNRLAMTSNITPFTLKDLKITRKIDDNGNKTLILTLGLIPLITDKAKLLSIIAL